MPLTQPCHQQLNHHTRFGMHAGEEGEEREKGEEGEERKERQREEVEQAKTYR